MVETWKKVGAIAALTAVGEFGIFLFGPIRGCLSPGMLLFAVGALVEMAALVVVGKVRIARAERAARGT